MNSPFTRKARQGDDRQRGLDVPWFGAAVTDCSLDCRAHCWASVMAKTPIAESSTLAVMNRDAIHAELLELEGYVKTTV